MPHFKFVHDYKENDMLRHSFFALAKQTFDIDFEPWYQLGAWNDQYKCYSLAVEDQIIANVSVNQMTVQVNGQTQSAIQIGTVMTHPDYQKQGLAGRLLTEVLNRYEDQVDFIYLFANNTVLDFYPKYGFNRQQESQFMIDVNNQLSPSKKHYRQLDINSSTDRELLETLATDRLPNSQQLGIRDNLSLLWFYFVNVFPDALFYFEAEQTLIIAEKTHTTLEIFDIIQKAPSPFKPLLSQLIDDQTQVIQLHFSSDNQEFQINHIPLTETDDYLFVKPKLKSLQSPFLFPLTSHG